MGRDFHEGLRRLQRKMTRDIPQAARHAAALSVTQGAQEIANLQQNLVPYDDGALHDSIVVTPPGGTTPPYSQPGGFQRAREGQAIITAGNTDVRYAHLVEYGSAPHEVGGLFAGAQHPGTAAQPFFWPAYRALRTRVKSRITRAVTKAIKDGAK
jgi:HK97 gp10 family phage protein